MKFKLRGTRSSIALCVVALGITLLVGYQGGQFYQSIKDEVIIAKQKSTIQEQDKKIQDKLKAEEIIARPFFKTIAYKLRQVDLQGFVFEKFLYPAELQNLSNDELVGMRCTNSVNLKLSQANKSSEDSFVLEMQKDTNNFPENYLYCETSDNRTFYEYEDIDRIYFAQKINQSLKKLSSIDGVFTTCSPLLLTTENIMYYECAGGDTRAHTDLYKVDNMKKSVTNILSCVTDFPGLHPAPSTCTPYPKS